MTAALNVDALAEQLADRDPHYAAKAAQRDDVPGVRIEDVMVGERARKDYGDLASLKESILRHGLLQPIVLLPDNRLLCGGRRLEACRQLDWESIPFVRSTTRDDAISRLMAERDENTCRKDMTPSELVELGRKLEELKRPEAEERQREGQMRGRSTRWDGSCSAEQEPSASSRGVRGEVAEALGMSESQYFRAKRVVTAAEDASLPDQVREAAQVALTQMDAGEITITTADNLVRQTAKVVETAKAASGEKLPPAERLARIAEMAQKGHTSDQIGKELGHTEDWIKHLAKENGIDIRADRLMRGTKRVDHNRVIAKTVEAAEMIMTGVDFVDFAKLDRDQINGWADSLQQSIKALAKLRKSLLEELAQPS